MHVFIIWSFDCLQRRCGRGVVRGSVRGSGKDLARSTESDEAAGTPGDAAADRHDLAAATGSGVPALPTGGGNDASLPDSRPAALGVQLNTCANPAFELPASVARGSEL